MSQELLSRINAQIADNENRSRIFGGRAGVEAMADDNNNLLRELRAALTPEQGEATISATEKICVLSNLKSQFGIDYKTLERANLEPIAHVVEALVEGGYVEPMYIRQAYKTTAKGESELARLQEVSKGFAAFSEPEVSDAE
jgi:hypothetical protein